MTKLKKADEIARFIPSVTNGVIKDDIMWLSGQTAWGHLPELMLIHLSATS